MNGPETSSPVRSRSRRADLDLLRALVVIGLIVLHSAVPFTPGYDWFVKNPSTNFGFLAFVVWAALWGMPLLFVVSGMGVQYALRARSALGFVRERMARLFVPYLFGLLVLVPPMFYLGFSKDPGFHQPYGTFWLRFLDLRPALRELPAPYEWTSYGRVLDASHLWFLYYLLLYSVLLLPVFLFLRREAGARVVDLAGRFLGHWGAVLALGLPMALLEAWLGTEETGGWNRAVYAIPLLYGFLAIADRRFESSMRRHRRLALGLGVAGFVALVLWGVILGEAGTDPLSGGGLAAGWRALKGFVGWWWVVAILGFSGTAIEARRAREKGSVATAPGLPPGRATGLHRMARYANEAVLPFYVLHMPVIVVVAYVVVRWDIGILPKYLAVVVTSFAGTLALYDGAVRRFRATRFLFGMKTPPDRRWLAESRGRGSEILRGGATGPPGPRSPGRSVLYPDRAAHWSEVDLRAKGAAG